MGIIFAFFRRFFGGYDSKYDWLEQRGVQATFCILVDFVSNLFIIKRRLGDLDSKSLQLTNMSQP